MGAAPSDAKSTRRSRSAGSREERPGAEEPPAPEPRPGKAPELEVYFRQGYLQGEAFKGGSYTAILEEVNQHSLERLVELFMHTPTHVCVWSEALDLRPAQPHSVAVLLFHYCTRDTFLALDYRLPMGEAIKALSSHQAAAVTFRASAREPSQLAPDDGAKRYCVPMLAPQSCCQGPEADVLVTLAGKDLQLLSRQGWSCLRPKLLDRLARGGDAITQDYWRCQGEFAVGLFLTGHVPPALQNGRQAAEGCKAQFGALHPQTLRLQHNMAAMLHHGGFVADAGFLFQSVLDGRTQALGQNHPATLRTATALAELLGQLNRHQEAQVLHKRALQGKQGCYGMTHPESLSSMVSLAWSHWKVGEQEQADALYRRALLISESLFGPGHPTTLHCLNNLAAISKDCGREGELDRLLGRRPGCKGQPIR